MGSIVDVGIELFFFMIFRYFDWMCDFYYSLCILHLLSGFYISYQWRVLISISSNADSDKNSFVYVRTSNSSGIGEDL